MTGPMEPDEFLAYLDRLDATGNPTKESSVRTELTPAQVEDDTRCDRCPAYAVWSICNLEGDDMQPIVRWFACGRHLHTVLTEGDWELDAVHVYDLRGPSLESA